MRDSADTVLLAEVIEENSGTYEFRLHQALKSPAVNAHAENVRIAVDEPLSTGTLALLFGAQDPRGEEHVRWQATAVDETSLAYFAGAPSPRTDATERLVYFARFLEHPDPVVAEDAYQEFGHAPFDRVAAVADHLSSDELRRWLRDDRVPQHRKGFYGLALGLPREQAELDANVVFLREFVTEPAVDFRAGYDGALAGFLLAGGEDALVLIEQLLLANLDAAEGDVRHGLAALRFLYEFGRDIPPERLVRAMRLLLERPSLSAAAVVDLARWNDWESLDRVAALYAPAPADSPALRRAVVGYLLACGNDAAMDALESLRSADPQGVAIAEQHVGLLGGTR